MVFFFLCLFFLFFSFCLFFISFNVFLVSLSVFAFLPAEPKKSVKLNPKHVTLKKFNSEFKFEFSNCEKERFRSKCPRRGRGVKKKNPRSFPCGCLLVNSFLVQALSLLVAHRVVVLPHGEVGPSLVDTILPTLLGAAPLSPSLFLSLGDRACSHNCTFPCRDFGRCIVSIL